MILYSSIAASRISALVGECSAEDFCAFSPFTKPRRAAVYRRFVLIGYIFDSAVTVSVPG